jgi:hypothetical protein
VESHFFCAFDVTFSLVLSAFIEREDLIITHPPWYKSLIVPRAFARPIPDGGV